MKPFVPAEFDWLEIRYRLDARSRSLQVLRDLNSWCQDRRRLRVADIGCGAGAQVRFLEDFLGSDVDWCLVERDAALLDRARARVPSKACFLEDFCDPSAEWWQFEPDLVVANAVFDILPQEKWDEFLATAYQRLKPGSGVYLSTHIDGRMAFSPATRHDKEAIEAFQMHMRRPQPWGQALGGKAAPMMEKGLLAGGWQLSSGDSDWVIEAHETSLLQSNLEFMKESTSPSWWQQRKAAIEDRSLGMLVGHRDLFAVKPS